MCAPRRLRPPQSVPTRCAKLARVRAIRSSSAVDFAEGEVDGLTSGMDKARIVPTVDGYFPALLVGPIRVFRGPIALGNGVVIEAAAMRSQKGIVLGVLGIGAWEFSGPTSADEVASRLGCHDSDAGQIADLITDQFAEGKAAARQGVYLPSHCDKGSAGDDTYRED